MTVGQVPHSTVSAALSAQLPFTADNINTATAAIMSEEVLQVRPSLQLMVIFLYSEPSLYRTQSCPLYKFGYNGILYVRYIRMYIRNVC